MRIIPFPVRARATGAMANIGLLGPYRLNFDEISEAITRTAPGVYALGHRGPDGKFYIDAVGRADKDIRGNSNTASHPLWKQPSTRSASSFTNSSRRATDCTRTACRELIGNARAAGFSAFKG
jgi:hypothetical protein